MDKKGAITQATLVIIIIFAVSVVIILFVVTKLNLGGSVDKTACETSVSWRSALSSEYFPVGQKLINLRCKTEKTCLYKDKKECNNLAGSDIEYIKVEDKDQINKAMADKMAECWAMMGEGKLDVFRKEAVDTGKCVVCTRIGFEDGLRKSVGSADGFISYMRTHQIEGREISYWQFITNNAADNVYTPKGQGIADKIDISNKEETRAIVFYEARRGTLLKYFVIGSSALGGAASGAIIGSIVPGVGTFIGAGIGFALTVGGAAGGAYAGYEIADSADDLFRSKPDIVHQLVNIRYSKEEFNQLGCKDFENLA